MRLRIPDQGNPPGDCFWMGWWGYAKREQFLFMVLHLPLLLLLLSRIPLTWAAAEEG